jgi:hypothetical protein
VLLHGANTKRSGYAPTPLDLAHISFDDDDDLQLLQEGTSPVAQDHQDAADREAGSASSPLPSPVTPDFYLTFVPAGARISDASKGVSMRRLIMLYSEDKAVIVIGALLALVASPVEVVQFIYVSLALDDAATDGSKASFSGSIGMLCILYAIAAAAVTLNLMLLQSVGHRVAARVRRSLVASVLRQEVSFLFGHNDDILQQTLGADVESIRKAVSSHLARWIQACVQVPAPAAFRLFLLRCLIPRCRVQVFVGSALLFVLSWRLALALLSALPIIAIAMVLQVNTAILLLTIPSLSAARLWSSLSTAAPAHRPLRQLLPSPTRSSETACSYAPAASRRGRPRTTRTSCLRPRSSCDGRRCLQARRVKRCN